MPSTQQLPWFRLLIGASLAVFVYQQVVGTQAAVEEWSVYGPAVTDGEWWRVVSGAFVHANLPHLIVNVISLLALGRLIESDLRVGGAWRFPLLALCALLSGSAGVLLLSFEIPTVGISGLVFGLLGAAIAIPRRVGLSWNAYGALPWLGFNLAVTFAVPGISVGGHLGGLIGGFLAGWLLCPVAQLKPLADGWTKRS